MARIRTVKPEFFTSETIAALPFRARVLFIGLWTQADDEGRMVDNARVIKGQLFALDDDVTSSDLDGDLEALADVGLITRYAVGGKDYIAVNGFREHQAVNRPTPSKIPAPGGPQPPDSGALTDDSVSAHGGSTERSRPERKGKEGKGKEESRSDERVSERELASVVPLVPSEPADAGTAKPDPLYDALVLACGLEYREMTDRERRAAGIALAEIRKRGATPEDCASRAVVFARKFPHVTLTPNALAKNWAACKPRPNRNDGGPESRMSAGAVARW